jgi:spectinomycin phosphotransferase
VVGWSVVGAGARAACRSRLRTSPRSSRSQLAAYAEATGHRIDHAALDVYRLAWDVNDVAESLNVLRSPHGESEDTTWAYDALTTCMPTRDQWSRLLVR